ncbi:MAG: hypothetical protein RLY66_18 [Candidatus Parcubacteria bacterium]
MQCGGAHVAPSVGFFTKTLLLHHDFLILFEYNSGVASNSKPIFISLAAATSLAMFGGNVWMNEHRPPMLEIFIFALKSGQATLVRTPDDERILIDGGPNAEIVRKISSVLPFYSRRIDAIVATNTDGKNVSGLIDIIERYHVGRVYIPAVTLNNLGISTSTDPAYESFIDSVKEKGVESIELSSGNIVSSDSEKKFQIEAVFPVTNDLFEYSKASGPQVILKVSYGNHSLLLLGDATVKVQKYIASSIGEADIVAVSHSAATENMARDLISQAKPKYLVYSKTATKSKAVKSQSKKPAEDPLAGILIGNRFNLKDLGMVKITMNGESLEIQGK